ncbi:3-hydroxyacyl-ACP dehydratase FabZ [Desulfogranum marinum]|uniref:3-hydroxyacyl-ACP dehydratase FabZ n=1 Tax=Desulfogranum marinum TaxID=453220 RepID=UPI0019657E89|nr:3-hydroxyacyl-ACP dehydratase FabZ [Desulfogranum marinum]MBM9511446.1 3-hydroxyacyl-ACP dehydratase FabZ [Desulfogranum marinum]
MELNDQHYLYSRIPHRPPFLWLDEITEINEEGIRAKKTISANLDIFQGHYPDYPIMPGVLLCEAVFQAGAVYISELMHKQQKKSDSEQVGGIPVLTRILNARFKREVGPGDTIEIAAHLTERIGSAWFLKGNVRVRGQIAVQVEFACALKGD